MFPGKKLILMYRWVILYQITLYAPWKFVLHGFYAFIKIWQELNILEQVTGQSVSIPSLSH